MRDLGEMFWCNQVQFTAIRCRLTAAFAKALASGWARKEVRKIEHENAAMASACQVKILVRPWLGSRFHFHGSLLLPVHW